MVARKNYVSDSWQDIEKACRDAVSLSCRPDSTKFRKVRIGDVIDEEKSVRWNREEVDRLRTVYDDEVKRLNTVKNQALIDVDRRSVALVASEAELSEEKAKILWNFVYDKYHDDIGNMFSQIEDYIDLVCKLKG